MEWGILPNTVALAAVALLGYLFGRSGLRRPHVDPNQMRREFQRAREVVTELEQISLEVRRNLATHHGSVAKIQQRLNELQRSAADADSQEFCRDAERLLLPTQKMAQNMTRAYDALRKQSSKLNAFADARVDPLTGLSSRRAMDDSLSMLLALKRRYHNPFSIALVTIDDFPSIQEQGNATVESAIRQVAEVLAANGRETDIVARFGGAEFVVLMPETELDGAAVAARRVRRMAQRDTSLTISIGLAIAGEGDTHAALLHRAETALNSAHSAGGNCICQHDGAKVTAVPTTPFVLLDDAQPKPTQKQAPAKVPASVPGPLIP